MDDKMPLMIAMIILIGGFPILGAVFNWDWFFNNHKAIPIVKLFGRNGARIFYAIIGIFILGIGIWACINKTLSMR